MKTFCRFGTSWKLPARLRVGHGGGGRRPQLSQAGRAHADRTRRPARGHRERRMPGSGSCETRMVADGIGPASWNATRPRKTMATCPTAPAAAELSISCWNGESTAAPLLTALEAAFHARMPLAIATVLEGAGNCNESVRRADGTECAINEQSNAGTHRENARESCCHGTGAHAVARPASGD